METNALETRGLPGTTRPIEFCVFGDVAAAVAGDPVPLGGRKPRDLLAFLLLHRNETVPSGRIIDALWGDDPPLTVEASLRVAISKLRRALAAVGARDLIETRPSGYVLWLDHDAVDVGQFELLVEKGKDALADGAVAEASVCLMNGLALWKGEPYASIDYVENAEIERRRLSEIRRDAEDDLAEAQLALGRHRDLIPDLEQLVGEQPTRERRAGQLMLALYRSGRQAEALDVYRRVRASLNDELGLEPGPDLRRLEQAILAHDPSVAAPEPSVSVGVEADALPRPHGFRRWSAVIAAGLLIVAATVVAWTVLRPDSPAVTVNANSVAVIDQGKGRVVAGAPTGSSPMGVALTSDFAWIPNSEDATVTQVDRATRQVIRTIGIGFEPTDIAASGDAVWVVGGYDHTLVRIDPDGVIRIRIRFRERLGPLPEGFERGAAGVAVGLGGVWVAHGVELTLFDPATGARLETIRGGGPWAGSVAVAPGSIWVPYNGRLTAAGTVVSSAVDVVDPVTGKRRARIPVIGKVGDIDVADGSAWVAIPKADTVWRIDLTQLIVDATFAAGDDPVSIAVDRGLWISNWADATVSRIDPTRGPTRDPIPVGHTLTGLAADNGEVWVAVTKP